MILAGCCEPGAPTVFTDRFKNLCGDLPCGWMRERDSAEFVPTPATNSNRVELSDGGRIARPLTDVVLDGHQGAVDSIVIVLRCDPPASLNFVLEIDDAGTPLLLVGTLEEDRVPTSHFTQTRTVVLDPRDQDPPEPTPATRLTVELVGSGPCIIDRISITSGVDHEC
jgi:hypothetical protein